ncbi:MAG: hypothetical protein GY795_29990, partial [Desulfobacterales bacterium]|nr:hypothetical protein [Desulfobacterales bacterium]
LNFTSYESENGNFTVYETSSAEGSVTSYADQTFSNGYYESFIVGTSRETVTRYRRSSTNLRAGRETREIPDGQTWEETLAALEDWSNFEDQFVCETSSEYYYGLDPKYGNKVVKEVIQTTPAGLTNTVTLDKTYGDNLITERVSLQANLDGQDRTKTVTVTNNTETGVITTETATGRTVTTQYNPENLLRSEVSVPGLLPTEYDYDTRGRIKSVTAGTRSRIYEYDTKGNVDYIINPDQQTVDYDYDDMGRVISVVRPDSSVLYFDYDNNGNVKVLTKPTSSDSAAETADHGFGYNKAKLNNRYSTPQSGDYIYDYDRDGRLTKKTFPSGQEISYVYESGKDRTDYITTPEGIADYDYSCGSRLDSVTKGSESVSYEYDGNLVTDKTLTGTVNHTLSYGYDNEFRVKTFT